MARILVNTSVSPEFWDAIQRFGSKTKYIREHDRLKAAAYTGIVLSGLLDDYERTKAKGEKSEISLELLMALLKQIRFGLRNWDKDGYDYSKI
jgi:hypothetical protein